MNCFECAKLHDAIPAVGVCRHCGVGLCREPLRGMPAGIAAAARHHSAVAAS